MCLVVYVVQIALQHDQVTQILRYLTNKLMLCTLNIKLIAY